jgi:hypothetical protein
LLQALCSIWRLRPRLVSLGMTDRQFDFKLQSPHPSHTSSLMKRNFAGSAMVPFLRRRRFSAAQVCW